jgi:hypothetical protein
MHLLCYKDILKMLGAFVLFLSDCYWTKRLPADLVFEVDDPMKVNAEFDWQFLSLGVEKLLQRSPRLINRCRLLPVLKKARDLSFEEISKQNHEYSQGKLLLQLFSKMVDD